MWFHTIYEIIIIIINLRNEAFITQNTVYNTVFVIIWNDGESLDVDVNNTYVHTICVCVCVRYRFHYLTVVNNLENLTLLINTTLPHLQRIKLNAYKIMSPDKG